MKHAGEPSFPLFTVGAILPGDPPLLSQLLLTSEQVGQLLNVSEDCVLNLHRCGQLRGVKVGRYRRWRPEDVRRFVEGLGVDEGNQ